MKDFPAIERAKESFWRRATAAKESVRQDVKPTLNTNSFTTLESTNKPLRLPNSLSHTATEDLLLSPKSNGVRINSLSTTLSSSDVDHARTVVRVLEQTLSQDLQQYDASIDACWIDLKASYEALVPVISQPIGTKCNKISVGTNTTTKSRTSSLATQTQEEDFVNKFTASATAVQECFRQYLYQRLYSKGKSQFKIANAFSKYKRVFSALKSHRKNSQKRRTKWKASVTSRLLFSGPYLHHGFKAFNASQVFSEDGKTVMAIKYCQWRRKAIGFASLLKALALGRKEGDDSLMQH